MIAVLLALSRMEFFPAFVLKRNKLRGTPHYSIALATGIPIAVLIIVHGNINILGDMYAFGLLGAFTLTCLGLDIVRHRERKAAKAVAHHLAPQAEQHDHAGVSTPNGDVVSGALPTPKTLNAGDVEPNSTESGARGGVDSNEVMTLASAYRGGRGKLRALWFNLDYWLGILTTLLVATAWSTNLVSKPLATAFGGTVAGIGMGIAFINYMRYKRAGRLPVVTTGVEGRLPGSVLAVLTAGNPHNDAVIRNAIHNADSKPVVFLYVGDRNAVRSRAPRMFEVVDPYLEDPQAKETFGRAENLARKSKVPRRFVYRREKPDAVAQVWQVVHPRDTVVAAEDASQFEDINPDRIRYELTPQGKVAHLLKRW
jgi:hypothetical protein